VYVKILAAYAIQIFVSVMSEVWYESAPSERDEYRLFLQQQMTFEAL
jgi:hypothetical protein